LITYRKLAEDKSSKADEQESIDMQISSMVAAFSPLPLVGAGLMACSNADAMSSAKQILQYLESLKDAEANREGNMSSFAASRYLFFH
jgi:uncharacterized OsmC-like protein